jgi:lysophospholipase L1-like esterase
VSEWTLLPNGSTGDSDPLLIRFQGKKWSVIGDSITENIYITQHYYDYIKQWQGITTVNNYGKAGTGFFKNYGANLKIPSRLTDIATDSDVITIFAGTNDVSEPMGTFGDTDPAVSFYGALDYTFSTLINNFPDKPIGVITPIPRSDYWGSSNALQIRVDAIIQVAKKYSIPVLDLYRESGLRPWNTTNKGDMFYNADGLHPNNAGHLQIAYKIHKFMLTL